MSLPGGALHCSLPDINKPTCRRKNSQVRERIRGHREPVYYFLGEIRGDMKPQTEVAVMA